MSGGVGAYGFGATSGYRGDGDGASAITGEDGGVYSDGDALIKVGCRYYDPATGSFLTRDTDLGQSPYAYCDGDPVNATDPSGHFLVIIVAVLGIGFAIASFINAAYDADEVNTINTAANNMQNNLKNWTPKTDAGQDFKDSAGPAITNWQIQQDKGPGAGFIMWAVGVIMGLASPSLPGALGKLKSDAE